MKKNLWKKEKPSNIYLLNSINQKSLLNHKMTEESFFQKVYWVARKIPPGRVTSYGAIARYLGAGQSARMVGWAMNKAFTQNEFIPAHRVVNRNGLLTGKIY